MLDSLEEQFSYEQETNSKSWRGTSIFAFTKLTGTNLNIPPLVQTLNHKVYVKLPLTEGVFPRPYPSAFVDVWDNKHVRMPNSRESLYPMKIEGNRLVQRWLVIQEAFSEKITSVHDFRKAILSYNQRYEDKWNFEGLCYLIEDEFCEEEKNFFFENILPRIIQLALNMPAIVTRPPLLLKKKNTSSVSLSQNQIASLLANAFLCTFPRRNAKGSHSEYSTYPDINFNRLFVHKEKRALEKLKCIIHYFKEVTSRDCNGIVTFSRQCIESDQMPDFKACSNALSRLHIDSNGLIEEANGFLQVDFANKYIGGGVLGLGSVQEEIRFVLCPELLVTRLFTEVLDEAEVLIITGVEQFSEGKGYASEFEWYSAHRDLTPSDPCGRKLCQVVAMDAYNFSRDTSQQYKSSFVYRELRKAYSGFEVLNGSEGNNIAVATGNWGSGAFKGDPRFKGLIQLSAASVAKRDVIYFTFGDSELRDDLADVHQFLQKESITVGQLVMALCQYELQSGPEREDILTYVYRVFSRYDSETDSEDTENKKVEERNPSKMLKLEHKPIEEKPIIDRKITDFFKTSGYIK